MKVSEILDSQVNHLSHTVERYPFEDLKHYQSWSSQHYYLIQHTPRFLHLCCGTILPNEVELMHEFTHHLKEEMHHDRLIENDMLHFGYRLDSDPPFAPTISIIELQEHFIKTYGAVVFLGYGLVLEGMALKIGSRLAERIFKAHGKRSQFLDVHSKSDETHYPDGLARIDEYLVNERLKTAFVKNLKTTCFNYGEMIDACKRAVQTKSVDLIAARMPESFA
jgi:hypothetical protein